MMWTAEQQAEFLNQFHNDVIESAARRLAELGAETLVRGPDSNATSYFSRREEPRMKLADLELYLENMDSIKDVINDINGIYSRHNSKMYCLRKHQMPNVKPPYTNIILGLAITIQTLYQFPAPFRLAVNNR